MAIIVRYRVTIGELPVQGNKVFCGSYQIEGSLLTGLWRIVQVHNLFVI